MTKETIKLLSHQFYQKPSGATPATIEALHAFLKKV